MFFLSSSDAWMQAKLETVRTHRQHKVTGCKKYLANGATLEGYTIILAEVKK